MTKHFNRITWMLDGETLESRRTLPPVSSWFFLSAGTLLNTEWSNRSSAVDTILEVEHEGFPQIYHLCVFCVLKSAFCGHNLVFCVQKIWLCVHKFRFCGIKWVEGIKDVKILTRYQFVSTNEYFGGMSVSCLACCLKQSKCVNMCWLSKW